jgi:hypothetical protein
MSLLDKVDDMLVGTVASEEHQETVLKSVREAVEYYQPRIERRTGHDLGDVEVKPESAFIDDLIGETYKEFEEDLENTTDNSDTGLYNQFKKIAMRGALKGVKPLGKALYAMRRNPSRSMFTHMKTKDIYVPFGPIQTNHDLVQGDRIQKPEETTVHELSHILWFTIGDNDSMMESRRNNPRTFETWKEGFAEYCARHEFENILPDTVRHGDDPRYEREANLVKNVIQREGDILLDIPNRWYELHEKHNDLYDKV